MPTDARSSHPTNHLWAIRTQRPDELEAVMAVNDVAFGEEERVGQLVQALQQDQAFSGQSYVALASTDGQPERIIGHTMLTRCWVDAEDEVLTIPVLSPLAVHPDHAGQGVGKALVAYALNQAESAGAFGVVLEGDPAYYGRLGFEPAEAWGLLRPSPRIPRPAFQWVRFAAHRPWMRGRVVYPDVFWALDAVGLRGRRGTPKTLEITTVTLGATDVARLAKFYAQLLGRPEPTQALELVAAGTEDWAPIEDPDGGLTLAIQHEPDQERVTWPAAEGDQHLQLHLEIRADDLGAAVAHALACGATLADHQPQEDVRVMLDPEGHPFCLWVDSDRPRGRTTT